MSCQVEQIADCGDISSLARALFIADKEDANWLTQCSISLSSCGSLLAVGYKNRLVILSAQWINSTETNTFIISWSGTVSSDITAVLVVPICPINHSSQSGPDWYCIFVGFVNGAVGFYTNTGHLLLLEKFDEKTVLKISCHTGTYGTLPDDICVLYQSSECVVSGPSLFKTLRYAKAQLAKVQAGLQGEYSVDGRSISVRRWFFSDQDVINDGVVAGLELKNTYDHLLAASTYGGYDAWYRSIPPQNTLILGAGTKPYLGFHYALEGGTAPPLQDVARAVANKIKSALPGWLGGGTPDPATSKAEPHIRSESLSMRSGLCDIQRQGARVVLSPDKRLAAITDNLGRVTVLDVSRGHIFRMFKGYRDAQCAFLQVFEVDNKKPQLSTIKEIRRALFLVIYNPKKGLIDIRLMNKGERVAVFTATKNGKLLYNTSGLVGAEQSYVSRKLNLPEYQCALIDPDGKLKIFHIPFFFALEGEHSDRSKDLHILRELRNYIKKNKSTESDFATEILTRVSELKMIDLKKHCLEMLIRNYEIHPNIVMSCLELFWDSIAESVLDAQDLKCKIYFINLVLTTYFYRLINNENADAMENLVSKVYGDIKWDPNEVLKNISFKLPDKSNLQLLENDKVILSRLLDLAQEKDYKEHQHARVTFADNIDVNYKLFVCSFELEEDFRDGKLHLKSDLSQEKYNNLAADTFKSLFKIECYDTIGEYIIKCKLCPKDLVKMIISHLMRMSLDDINIDLIQKLIGVLCCICTVSNEATNIVYNESSEWWQTIRIILIDMPCPLRSMIVAMACRVVVQQFEDKNSNGDDDAWESVTTENAKWSILIGKLEDISILSIILFFKETFIGKSLPKLARNSLEVNLKYIYSRGKGSVTELISQWLCTMGVIPEAIIAYELSERERPVDTSHDDSYEYIFVENHKEYFENNPRIFQWFSLLRKQFPYSTIADNVIVNMCWEYAVAWQKDKQNMKLLEAVIYCLKNLKDVHLAAGMCLLVWMTYIKHLFETSCRLVSKVGKMPKERLCLQDVGLTEKQLIKFFELTTQYLEIFVNRMALPMDKDVKRFKFEKIWDESTQCLADVAQNNSVVNDIVLNLNYQISYSIYFQCQFNFKIIKHLHYLYDVDLQYVFGGMTAKAHDNINFKAIENKLRSQRIRFLKKVIMASIDLITCEESDDVDVFNKYQAGDMIHWISKVYILADLWNIESDLVRRQQIVGLYRLGYDSLVNETVRMVSEPELLLPSVLTIAILRLKLNLEQSSQPGEWIAAMPPDLISHMERMEIDPAIPANTSMKTTADVIFNVLVPIENSDKIVNVPAVRLARTVLKACEIVQTHKLQ